MNDNIKINLQNDDLDENTDLFEHHRITVDPGQSPVRIDVFLTNRLQNVSRNKIQQAAKASCILVNQTPIKQNYIIKPRDVISIVLPQEPVVSEVIPQDIKIEVVYEDDDVIIIDKPAGMVVHPAYNNYEGTLLNALAFHFKDKPNQANHETGAFLVHRIDKDTSGLLVVTKNEMAQTILAREFFEHSIERKYHALVWGDFKEDRGTIEKRIGRNWQDRRQMIVYDDPLKGKMAITHYRVLERFGYVTLIECRLETGRTHQIRAHMKYLGHPLFNDAMYGGNRVLKGTTHAKYKQFIDNCFETIPRQALHAKTLGFVHPLEDRYLLFNSEYPQDFRDIIEKWKKYTSSREIQ